MRIALGIALVALSLPAYAQQGTQCGPFAEMQKALKERFNETPAGYGQVNERAVIELFTSPDGGTWTILAIGADGKACFLSAGKDWVFEPMEPGKGT